MRVYSGEIFERSLRRYLAFGAIILAVMLIIIFLDKSIGGVVGVIIIFVLLGAYFFFMLRSLVEKEMLIDEEFLRIGERKIPLNLIVGFLLEQELKTGSLKNIVFVFDTYVEIYSLKDSIEKVSFFVEHLSQRVPLLDSYNQTLFEKILRKCKL